LDLGETRGARGGVVRAARSERAIERATLRAIRRTSRLRAARHVLVAQLRDEGVAIAGDAAAARAAGASEDEDREEKGSAHGLKRTDVAHPGQKQRRVESASGHAVGPRMKRSAIAFLLLSACG